MQDPIKAFGESVRVERARKNITQKDLAEKLNTSVRTVSKVENAQNSPRFETVAQFARELNISIDAIILEGSVHSDSLPRCAAEYFTGMSESRAEKYIELCRQADRLHYPSK